MARLPNSRCHRSHNLIIHTEITLNLVSRKLQHLFRQRWLNAYPEGVVHYVVGVGQVAGKIVGSWQLAVKNEDYAKYSRLNNFRFCWRRIPAFLLLVLVARLSRRCCSLRCRCWSGRREDSWQSAIGSWQSAIGSWQLAVGSWQLAVGSWQLAVGSEE